VCQWEEYAIILAKQTVKHSPSTDQINGLRFLHFTSVADTSEQ
jgi:hypothetical protein